MLNKQKNSQYGNYFTFLNNGTPFVFKGNKYTQGINTSKGQTMLRIHAELVLDARRLGRPNVDLLDSTGAVINDYMLKQIVKSGVYKTKE